MALLNQESDGQDMIGSSGWRWQTLSLLLTLASAFCFLKYLGWALVYSGNYGLPSQSGAVVIARQRSLAYLYVGMLAEGALLATLIVSLKFANTELTGLTKAVARTLSALLVAAVGTLGTMWLLSWLGRLPH